MSDKMELKRKLHKLAEILNDGIMDVEVIDSIADQPHDDDYLLRMRLVCWGPDDGLHNNLLLMGNLGVTFEPFKMCSTPTYCVIALDDLEIAAAKIQRVMAAHAAEELPYTVSEGEGAADNI